MTDFLETGDYASPNLAQVQQWLANTQRLAVLTGAGISAESGVPTFRDGGSAFWAQFKPEDMASEKGFRRDPALVWRWYQYRRELIAAVQPNAGHRALASWAGRHPGRMTLITQNVDGLHQRAGSAGVLNLHGELMQDRWLEAGCGRCQADAVTAAEPPRCALCGNMRRPAVVWFGEALSPAVWNAAESAANTCELMLVVGTSGAVYPAAGLAIRAKRHGAKIVIVNPQLSELDEVADVLLRGPAAQVLPALLAA
ncbi:MAG: NAD-dependent deacylase [Comamonas sp.]